MWCGTCPFGVWSFLLPISSSRAGDWWQCAEPMTHVWADREVRSQVGSWKGMSFGVREISCYLCDLRALLNIYVGLLSSPEKSPSFSSCTQGSLPYSRGSQGVVLELALSASPGNLLEVQPSPGCGTVILQVLQMILKQLKLEKHVEQGWTNFFCKGPGSQYQLCAAIGGV